MANLYLFKLFRGDVSRKYNVTFLKSTALAQVDKRKDEYSTAEELYLATSIKHENDSAKKQYLETAVPFFHGDCQLAGVWLP